MTILLDETTRVCVQGITGVGGREHSRSMLEYGTQVVAGVSPGHGGEFVSGIPVFETCHSAVAATGATLSVSFVGGRFALDAVLEAADAGMETVVCMEEFVPLWDTMRMRAVCRSQGCTLIGPNCNGLISPERGKVGFFPRELGRRGPIGIVSRSGTMSYAAMLALDSVQLGQSTVIGIGGNAIRGLGVVDCLELFASDDETEAVVLLGEIGGTEEQAAATRVSRGYGKPVVALIAGQSAPLGVAMGHAGAMAQGDGDGWEGKVQSLRAGGITVATDLEHLAELVKVSVR
jgi:succinyl-CoA synthetase alpha subunit